MSLTDTITDIVNRMDGEIDYPPAGIPKPEPVAELWLRGFVRELRSAVKAAGSQPQVAAVTVPSPGMQPWDFAAKQAQVEAKIKSNQLEDKKRMEDLYGPAMIEVADGPEGPQEGGPDVLVEMDSKVLQEADGTVQTGMGSCVYTLRKGPDGKPRLYFNEDLTRKRITQLGG